MNAKRSNTAPRSRLRALTGLLLATLGPAGWTQPAEARGDCTCNICVGSGETFLISGGTVTADCIQVETGGTLEILASSTLILTGPDRSCVDGEVLLKGSGSILRFTTNHHTVSCSGKIKGESDTAEIVIDNVTLTGDVKITGRLRITGAGDFTNEGSVTADRTNGTLDVQVTGTIADGSGASWEVAAAGAMLRFVEEPASLQGDFTVSDGTLRAGDDVAPGDDIDVVTTGNLTHTGGKIIAGVDDSFTFNGTRPYQPVGR